MKSFNVVIPASDCTIRGLGRRNVNAPSFPRRRESSGFIKRAFKVFVLALRGIFL